MADDPVPDFLKPSNDPRERERRLEEFKAAAPGAWEEIERLAAQTRAAADGPGGGRRTLDYHPPLARERHVMSGWERVAWALVLAAGHWALGMAAIWFATGRLIDAVVVAFLFPFGLVAVWINPHRMGEAFAGNSLFCGFALVYAYAFWQSRRRR